MQLHGFARNLDWVLSGTTGARLRSAGTPCCPFVCCCHKLCSSFMPTLALWASLLTLLTALGMWRRRRVPVG
jgi:hypothetical protein